MCPECPLSLRPPAGVGRRLVAHLVDVGLFATPLLLLSAAGRLVNAVDGGAGLSLWLTLMAFAAPVIVQVAMQLSRGRSVGKFWLGLRVINVDGTPMDAGRLLVLRNGVPLLVSGLCGLLPVVDAVMFLMPPHQRWTDTRLGARVIEDPR